MALDIVTQGTAVAANYNVQLSDSHLLVGQRSAALTLYFPDLTTMRKGDGFIVKDTTGQARAFPITIRSINGAQEIEGASTYLMDVDWGMLTVVADGDRYIVFGSNTPRVATIEQGGTDADTAAEAVDNLGLDTKDPVTVSAKTNINLSAIPNVVNGHTMLVNESANLWLQTDPTENGIYNVVDPGTGTDGVWERRADFNTSGEIRAGIRFLSLTGNSFAGVHFIVATNNPEIGVDDIIINPENDASPVVDPYGHNIFGYDYMANATNYLRAENKVAETAATLRGWSDTENHVSVSFEGKGNGKVWSGNPVIENLDPTTITNTSNQTYGAGFIVGGLITRDPNGANRTDTLPTAAQILAQIPQGFQELAWSLKVYNSADANETITVLAGSGITLIGTATIAQGEVAEFYFVITDAGTGTEAITVYRVNSNASLPTGSVGTAEIEDGAVTDVKANLTGLWPFTTTPTEISTAGVATYTATQLKTRLIVRDANGANRTDILPSAADIVASFSNPAIDQSFIFTVYNSSLTNETVTVSGGIGVTLMGNGLVRVGRAKQFLVVLSDVGLGTESVVVLAMNPTIQDGSLIFSGSALSGHSHTFTGDELANHIHPFSGDMLPGHTHTFTGSALSAHGHNIDKVVDEVVTVTTDAGTLAFIPGLIQNIFAVAAGTVGNKNIIPSGEAPGTGEVAVNMSTGVLTFNNGDAVTSVKVSYLKVATSTTSGGTPAGTLDSVSGGTPSGDVDPNTAGTPAGTISSVSGGTPAGSVSQV